MPERSTDDFTQAWEQASGISGWLTQDQARLLWDSADGLPHESLLVEIGSHQGRSTVILASQAEKVAGTVVAIDPFVDGRLFGGLKTRSLFEENIRRSGHTDTVELLPEYSTKALPSWNRPIDYLYIDGKHDYWTVSSDLGWARHLPTGAPVLIHDCFSSIGVTLGILARVLFSSTLTYERRAGSLALFRVGRPTTRDRVRIIGEMPWWIRNVAIKVLLRLRLRPLAARVFGHDSKYDPY